MRRKATAKLLVGALVVVPLVLFAAASNAQAQTSSKNAATHPGTHATTGVIKTVDDKTLVITRPGKKPAEMTFTMSASTAREGTMRAGSPVSVRYRQDGPTYLATAITVRPTTQQASNKSSAH
jgi:hypothetical protein